MIQSFEKMIKNFNGKYALIDNSLNYELKTGYSAKVRMNFNCRLTSFSNLEEYCTVRMEVDKKEGKITIYKSFINDISYVLGVILSSEVQNEQ